MVTKSYPRPARRTSPRTAIDIAMSQKVGDDALKAKTGRTWKDWIKILDIAKANEWDHKTIATYLYETHDLPGWWAQMVTVGYEQAKGLRIKHQRPNGFEISVSRTVPLTPEAAFSLWTDTRKRKRWLDEPLSIRKATPHKSLRLDWADGTSVEIAFYPRGDSKCQIVAQHSKLKNAETGERVKAWWRATLASLPTPK